MLLWGGVGEKCGPGQMSPGTGKRGAPASCPADSSLAGPEPPQARCLNKDQFTLISFSESDHSVRLPCPGLLLGLQRPMVSMLGGAGMCHYFGGLGTVALLAVGSMKECMGLPH